MVSVEAMLAWEVLVSMLSLSSELVRSVSSLNHCIVLLGPPWAVQVNSSVLSISAISWSKMIVGVDGATKMKKQLEVNASYTCIALCTMFQLENFACIFCDPVNWCWYFFGIVQIITFEKYYWLFSFLASFWLNHTCQLSQILQDCPLAVIQSNTVTNQLSHLWAVLR